MSCTLVFVFGNRHALLLRDKRSGPGDRAVCSPYGPATRLVSDPWPAVLPRRCRNLSHRSAVLPFFSQKPNPACGSARRIRPLVRPDEDSTARGSARPFRATAARVASLRRLCCRSRACGSVSRRSGRRNRSLRRHRRRVRTTRWPAEPLGRVLSSFPFCDRNGVKIRFTNIRYNLFS